MNTFDIVIAASVCSLAGTLLLAVRVKQILTALSPVVRVHDKKSDFSDRLLATGEIHSAVSRRLRILLYAAMVAAGLNLPNSTISATLAVPSQFESIQSAVDAAVNGDTIVVQPGVYLGPIDSKGKNLTIRGSYSGSEPTAQDIEQTIIEGRKDGLPVVTLSGGAPVLRCLTIRNGTQNGLYITGDAEATLVDLLITGNAGNGIDAYYAAREGRASRLHRVTSSRNRGMGCYAFASDMVVTQCRFTMNTVWGFFNYFSGNPVEIYGTLFAKNGGGFHSWGKDLLVNCTIADNQGDGCYSFHHGNLVNCIVWGNGTDVRPAKVILSIDFSVIQGGESGIGAPFENQLAYGPNNITADPRFISPSTGDYRLRDDSPAINVGDNAVITDPNARDLDGKKRILGGQVDLGAYERWDFYGERSLTVEEGSTGTLDPSAEDLAVFGGATFTVESGPEGLGVDPTTGRLSWTPTEAQGPGAYPAVIRARANSSAAATDTQTLSLVAREVNRAPSLALGPPQSVEERQPWSLILAGSDPDVPGNTLSYRLVSGPPGVTVNGTTGAVDWTPSEAEGGQSHDLTFEVTDNATPPLSAQATLRVVVSKVNDPPTVAALPDVRIPELAPWSAQLVGHDLDLPTQALTYQLVSGPAGLTIEPISGLIRWTPSEVQGPGSHPVRVRVTDSEGLFAEQAFVLSVLEVNQLPEPETVSVQRMVYGQALNLPLRAKDADQPANSLSFRLVSGPAGMTMATDGAVSWSPARAQVPSTNIVVAEVSDGVAEVPFTFRIETLDLITSINGQEVTNVLQALPPVSVAIASVRTNWPIFFSLDGTEPTRSSTLYTGPFILSEASTVWPIQFSPDFGIAVLGVPAKFVALKPQVVTLSGGEGLRFQGDPVPISATASSGLPVSLEVIEGPARVEGGRLVALGGGVVRLRAYQPGDAIWAPASLEVTRTIAKAPQTITWSAPATARLIDGQLSLQAVASSALPVAFMLLDGPATLTGATLRLDAAGSVKLRASQDGDANFEPATLELAIQVLPPPMITLQPETQTVAPGGSVSFSIEAQGTPPLAVQWLRNGVNLPGATGTTLTLRGVQPANAGLFSAVVSDAGGSVTSLAATLRVAELPTITRQPIDQSLNAGQSLSVSVTAAGTGPLAYQWRRNGQNIGGATQATLVVADVTPDDAGSYDVVVSSPYGSQTSASAKVTISIKPPVITFQPQGISTNAGSRVVLAVVATGVPPLSYQWQLWGDPIPGATNAVLDFPSIDPADTGTYKVTVIDRYASTVSLGATLLVTAAPPIITRQPLSLSVDAGSPATLTVTATGVEPLTFQWVHNGVPVPGATGSTLTIPSAAPSDTGAYKVTVRDRYAETTSQGAVLTVRWAAPTFVLQPVSQTAIEDGQVTFTATATGIPQPAFQWRHDGVDLPGQSSNVLHLLDLTPADAGAYQLVARNSFGEALSQTALLTLKAGPSLGEALDALPYFFRTGGAASWQMQTIVTHDMADAAVSGAVPDGQSSWIETRVNGPGTLSFWWKVSSETGFDRLNFTLGGKELTNLTGEVAWRQQTTAVPAGPQVLRWEYRKDGSGSAGQDRGWLDQFAYTSAVEQPAALALPRFRDRDGRFQLRLVGQPGTAWSLQSSADLLRWELLQTFTNTSPRHLLIDPHPPASNQRMYRLVPAR